MGPPPQEAELMDDMVAEILLRLPPDEPACLARAALVCKPWCRLLSDPAFRRRYRSFHGGTATPPVLGYLHNVGGLPRCRVVPLPAAASSSPVSRLPALCTDAGWWTLDCRHGRVLFESSYGRGLVVWNPITGHQDRLLALPFRYTWSTGTALCAVTDGSCDHLDCHSGPFLVVFVAGTGDACSSSQVSVYSSETRAWSASATVPILGEADKHTGLVVGDAVYFTFHCGYGFVKVDLRLLLGGQLESASVVSYTGVRGIGVVAAEDGGLRHAAMQGHSIHMRQWREEGATWEKCRVIELKMLPPDCGLTGLVGFTAEGTGTIFIGTDVGLFALDLKSEHLSKLVEPKGHLRMLPYITFYTPDFAKSWLSPP